MTDPIDQSDLLDHAGSLVDAALKAGATAADAVVIRGRSQSISCRLGEIDSVDRSEGDDAGLRVFVGKRQAIVSSNQIDPSAVADIATRAVEMAKVSPEDPYAGLPDHDRLACRFPDLELIDQTSVSVDTLEQRARETEDSARAVEGITNSNGATASWSVAGVTLASSEGFRGQYLRSGHALSCSVVAGSGTTMETDYDHATATHFADMPDCAEIGRQAAQRATRRVNPQTPDSRAVPVIFEPRVAASLVGHFAGAINGTAIARQSSFLRGHLGKRVFMPGVEIIDDPLRLRGLRSRPFDGEGVTVARHTLVEDGILNTWLLDSATARELELESTGHATRGVGSSPSPGPSNLHMAAGPNTPENLIGGIREGVFVTDLIGQGVNGVTGDYSRGAAGFWIENGELTYPVSQLTIAGNLIDMFANLTPASDLEFRYGTNAPTILVEGMTVAGR